MWEHCQPHSNEEAAAQDSLFFFFFFNNFMYYLFLTVLDLPCWAGFSLILVFRLLFAMASLVLEHRLRAL